MRFGTLCSGIEGAAVAWSHLKWEPAFASEVDPFCCALIEKRHPQTVNLGDVTAIDRIPAIDVLAAGTPCQSYSVQGKREGMDDARGQLALALPRLAGFARPRWIVWENVPGVLSTNGGRDFGAFLGALVQLGYAYQLQLQFQMAVLGAPTSYIAVLLNNSDFRWHEVPRHERVIAKAIAVCGQFWRENVQARVAPRVDASDATRLALQKRYPKPVENVVEVNGDLAEAAQRYDSLAESIKTAESEKSLLANRLREFMGDATAARLPDGTGFKWSGSNGSRRFTRAKKVRLPDE